MIIGEEVAHPVREAQNELPDGDKGDHMIDQVSCELCHASASAARTDAASFTGKGDEAFRAAAAATKSGEARHEASAGEIRAQLLFDEVWDAVPIGGFGGGDKAF